MPTRDRAGPESIRQGRKNALYQLVSTPVSAFVTSRSPHATPTLTTMRYDRARKNLDRHPNYILAAFMASGT